MGIKNLVVKSAGKAASQVSKLASLSPEELEKVDLKRNEYLSKLPDPTDTNASEITNRLLAANATEIYNAYLPQIRTLYLPINHTAEYGGREFDSQHNIRLINVTKWVVEKSEKSLDKLINVYAVLSNEEVNISLIFHRMVEETKVYLAVTNLKNTPNQSDISNYKTRLVEAVKGNFPGSELKDVEYSNLNFLAKNTEMSVAAASNIPTEKSEKFISQTIEKLLDGIVPQKAEEEYVTILMATPIMDVEERRLRLSEIYSGLAPYATWQTNFTLNDGRAFGASATVGVNVGASAGLQNTANQALTQTNSENDTNGHTEGNTNGESTSKTEGWGAGTSGTIGIGTNMLSPIQVSASGTLSVNHNWSTTKTKSTSKNVADSVSKTVGKAVSTTKGLAKGTNFGVNFGANFARASNVTATLGYGEGIIQNYTNYSVKHTLDLLEEQIKRYEVSLALGMWDFGAYVLSEDSNVANNVAHSYLALTQGTDSNLSTATINLWRGDLGESSQSAREIISYLQDLRHPMFGLNPDILSENDDFSVYPATVTATTPVSGKELAYSLNFPSKSISGLPVIETAAFGRSVSSYDILEPEIVSFELGKIFHMNHEENLTVKLSLNSMASHTFITGSTGSGKSNSIYQILKKTSSEFNIPFLVVEPAKGEYKNVFGKDVAVYGSNPKLTALLRINPFRFPNEIHVLEHLDRLVELFNACWPMYAAMPAILKEAMEEAYKSAGWDIESSENLKGDVYPNFADVLEKIEQVINESKYSADSKGDYSGALLTRVRSLTNGLNGQIFTNNDLSDAELFDSKVIVDLSRIGSVETKSLIMGLLVMKLNEYRMTSGKSNSALSHLTVLEEAHNLLKRTASEQSTESTNLVGKSVEMLANSIAEMRTYGEGFIIADQAPGLMDPSVIRNTNTKIIMRLPDQSDRELVGKSAGLNDDQIIELAKLPRGVAAVYQNEWIEPVLCKINKVQGEQEKYFYNPDEKIVSVQNVRSQLVQFLLQERVEEKLDFDINEIKKNISRLQLSKVDEDFLLDTIENYEEKLELGAQANNDFGNLSRKLSSILRTRERVNNIAIIVNNNSELTKELLKISEGIISDASRSAQIELCHCLMKDFSLRNDENEIRESIYKNWVDEIREGGTNNGRGVI